MPAEFAKVLGAAAGLLLAGAATASAAPVAAPSHAPAYVLAQPSVQYGNAFAFHNRIPLPVLEQQITVAQYRQMVQGAAQSNTLLPADDARVQRLHSFVDRLAPYAVKWNDRVKGWHWELNVVRSRGTRIVCLPGGKLLVDSGLLDRLRLNDNEWGVLLTHEMAHALRERAREGLGDMQVAATLGTNPISSLYGLTEPLPALPDIAERRAALRYGPTDETEADVIGGDIAARAGFDPRAAITLWDKLAAATRGDHAHGFIYAHPYDKRRRQDLLKRLGDWMPVYAKAIGKRIETLPAYAGISAVQRKTRRR